VLSAACASISLLLWPQRRAEPSEDQAAGRKRQLQFADEQQNLSERERSAGSYCTGRDGFNFED
jgi:hypothetical protein